MLYERHAVSVLRFLRAMVGGELANDCLQETFLRVYRDLDRYDQQRSFRGWAFGVARNVALGARRSEARRPTLPLIDPAPAASGLRPVEEAARREEQALVRTAVDQLPDDQREVFLLKQVEGLTFREVAEALGCSQRTAKYRMRAASEQLAGELRRKGLLAGGAA